jgi:dipeptide transport system ATP-binding protein
MLEAIDLARSYAVSRGPFRKSATVRAVDGVSFTLASGQTLAVVGESGCGKSTLSRLLCGMEQPSAGKLLLDGAPLRADPRSVQMIFQDPYGSLNPRKTTTALIDEPLRINTDQDAGERLAKVREILAQVGLGPEHETRYPHMFSGGQRQRIAIARALVLRPRILIADEPVSALDLSVQSQIINLLMDLRDEFKLALIFVSHNLHVVRHVADTVLVMYLGRAVEQGPAASVFARPLHPYTQALLSSTPSTSGRKKTRLRLAGELPSPLAPPAGCALNTRCPFATELCRTTRPAPREIDERRVACHHVDVTARGQTPIAHAEVRTA